MPGPLPSPERRRRNAPTIPTTALPASGRRGPVPKVPDGYELGEAGRAWWSWAWSTPQAAGWSSGDLYVVARRASLEDARDVLLRVDVGADLCDLLDDEVGDQLRWLIGRLKGLAAGDLQVAKEARELDDRLGLTPKGLAALRWKIVEDQPTSKAGPSVAGQYGRLRTVPDVG